jgi:hypothetical protein
MKCRHVLSLLSSYVDDEVDFEEKQVIEDHIKECENCGKALVDLRETIGRIRKIEPVPVPEDVAQRIKENIRREQKDKKAALQSEKSKGSVLSRRSLRYALVFSGFLALVIAIMIPFRAFQYFEARTKEAETFSQNAGSAKDRLSTQKNQGGSEESVPADGVHAGNMVRLSTANYNSRGVERLREYYKGLEKGESTTAVYSPADRDSSISNMFEEANNLKLDSRQLARCLDNIIAKNEAVIPVYSEKAKYEGQEVWIIVAKSFSLPDKGFDIAVYVCQAETGNLLHSVGGQ